MAKHPRVTIQVIPFSSGSYRMYGTPYIMMTFEDAQMPSIVYLEAVHGNVYLERQQDVRHYAETFSRQQDAALPPAESLQLIERLAARHT
jgi:hypothetical protein